MVSSLSEEHRPQMTWKAVVVMPDPLMYLRTNPGMCSMHIPLRRCWVVRSNRTERCRLAEGPGSSTDMLRGHTNRPGSTDCTTCGIPLQRFSVMSCSGRLGCTKRPRCIHPYLIVTAWTPIRCVTTRKQTQELSELGGVSLKLETPVTSQRCGEEKS